MLIFNKLGFNKLRGKKLQNLLHFSALLNILYVTELPEVFWTLGTKLSRVLSFFTLRRDFMDLKKPLTFDEQLDKLIVHGMIVADRENLLKRLPDESSKKSLIQTAEAVIDEYRDDIDLNLIGFPEKYLEIMENNL